MRGGRTVNAERERTRGLGFGEFFGCSGFRGLLGLRANIMPKAPAGLEGVLRLEPSLSSYCCSSKNPVHLDAPYPKP